MKNKIWSKLKIKAKKKKFKEIFKLLYSIKSSTSAWKLKINSSRKYRNPPFLKSSENSFHGSFNFQAWKRGKCKQRRPWCRNFSSSSFFWGFFSMLFAYYIFPKGAWSNFHISKGNFLITNFNWIASKTYQTKKICKK